MPRPRYRACLQDGLSLDLNAMARRGMIRSGSLCPGRYTQWTCDGEVVASALISWDLTGEHDGWFQIRANVLNQRIILHRFPRHFGGGQWYFRCPVTYRHVSVLWRPPGAKEFASRHAWRRQVAYRSQFQAPHDRALSQGQALRAKLGGWDWAGYCGDDPPKQKWMRRKTYNRILDRSYDYERIADLRFMALMGRRYGSH